MSEKITLYYHGSEPGGLEGIKRSFRFGECWTFDKATAESLLSKPTRSWFTKEEFDVFLKSREESIKKRYGMDKKGRKGDES